MRARFVTRLKPDENERQHYLFLASCFLLCFCPFLWLSLFCVICGLSLLTLRTPVGRSSAVCDATNLRAAPHASFAFAIVNLPEVFKRCAVRESFFEFDRAANVFDCEAQHVANLSVQPRGSGFRELCRDRERTDAGAKQGLGCIDVSQAKHLCLIQQ